MSELKPCPKCGDAWLYASEGDYGSGYESFGYRVGCMCGYAWRKIVWQKTKEQAINAWNRNEDGEQDEL